MTGIRLSAFAPSEGDVGFWFRFWEEASVPALPCPNPNSSADRDLKSESDCGSRRPDGRSLAAEIEARNASGTLLDLDLSGEVVLELEGGELALELELDAGLVLVAEAIFEVKCALEWVMDRNVILGFRRTKLARCSFLEGEVSCTSACRIFMSCSLLPGDAPEARTSSSWTA